MKKEKQILEFSNPEIVRQKGNELFLNPVHLSSRKDKKYMVFFHNKMVHFGAMGYGDFTKHNDERKQKLFNQRNARWKNAPRGSPSWLSYWILWN